MSQSYIKPTLARKKQPAGFLLVLVIVLGSVFFLIVSAFIGYIVTQNKVVNQKVELQQALEIAEAGLNYYRWFLAHNPDDVTNGTGLPGPYVQPYFDPEVTDPIGEFSLDIESTSFCGDIASIEVASTGYTYDDPTVQRTIVARYAQPSVADYAFIIDANVWAGDDRIIVGPYHSNQGIRMDGTNLSTVSSGLSNWTCGGSFGCSPNQTVDGVFTSTAFANPALFSFPSPPINFANLTIDLVQMKDRAQNGGGRYIGPSGAGSEGYRVVFNGDDTYTVYEVSNTASYWGFSTEAGWQAEDNVITEENAIATHTIDPNCPLLFVEDKVWLEGEVNQKVTVAAADTDSASVNPDIILEGDITYTDPENDGLLAVAENNVLLGVTVPDDMAVNGIFVAQSGRYGRNLYCDPAIDSNNCWRCNWQYWWGGCGSWTNHSLPSSLRPYVLRNSLTTNGTIVSKGRVGTKWSQGNAFVSGFDNRSNSYDRNLVESPPPLVPNTSDVYEFTEWREEN